MTPKIDLSRLKQFQYAIINTVEKDGFPSSLPTSFEITAQQEIVLKKPTPSTSLDGRTVGILFNHISAIPAVGYTDRRYMQIWGKLSEQRGKLKLAPDKFSEWDEKILPFDQLCARAAPQGRRYLEKVQRQNES